MQGRGVQRSLLITSFVQPLRAVLRCFVARAHAPPLAARGTLAASPATHPLRALRVGLLSCTKLKRRACDSESCVEAFHVSRLRLRELCVRQLWQPCLDQARRHPTRGLVRGPARGCNRVSGRIVRVCTLTAWQLFSACASRQSLVYGRGVFASMSHDIVNLCQYQAIIVQTCVVLHRKSSNKKRSGRMDAQSRPIWQSWTEKHAK